MDDYIYLYIVNQEEGLKVFGPHDMQVQAENTLLLDLLDTVSTVHGAIITKDNADVINDAWSHTGFEVEMGVYGTDNITMYLRKIVVAGGDK